MSPTPDEPRVVLFDMDLTLVSMNTFWAFGRALVRDGVVERKAIARAALENVLYVARLRTLDEAMATAYRLIEGQDVRTLERYADRFVREEVAPAVFTDARARIERHQAAGDRVVVASAAPAFLVERVAALVGVPEALATRHQITRGIFGQVLLPGAWGDGKVKLAERAGLLEKGRPHVYTDHVGDLALVRASGFATLVNPMPSLVRAVRRESVKHELVRWRRTVGQ